MTRGGLSANFGGRSDQEECEEQGSEEACKSHEGPQIGFWGIPMLPCGLWDLHDNSGFVCRSVRHHAWSRKCTNDYLYRGTSAREDGRHRAISCHHDGISDGKLVIVPERGLAPAMGVERTRICVSFSESPAVDCGSVSADLGGCDGDGWGRTAAREAMGMVDRRWRVCDQWSGGSADAGCASGPGEGRLWCGDCFAFCVSADALWNKAVFLEAGS